MHIEQWAHNASAGWRSHSGSLAGTQPQLVLAFGERHLLAEGAAIEDLRRAFPSAHVVVASTSGEIVGTDVTDGISATAIALERTSVRCASVDITQTSESYVAAQKLAEMLQGPDLTHVFVVSDGQSVNGAELARGFADRLPPNVRLTGGLAGDAARFELTLVGLDGPPVPGRIVATGFYGRHLEVGFGCAGGWETFGPERTVTRSNANVLLELDGESALQLYKRYLGDLAAELPGSALWFPLGVIEPGATHAVVRTILSIDEATGQMVFAGDIPQGSRAWLMRGSHEDLIGGAESAAEQSRMAAAPELAICVSCVGRRLVLGQRTEEETESVRAALGAQTPIIGFYSYGELAPNGGPGACRLHNETMTITTLREV
jgi:hypothetical protein